MKKLFLFLIACCSSLSLFADPQNALGRSFMLTRPTSYHLAVNQQLWHSIAYNDSGWIGGAFQAIGIYSKSMHNHQNNRYFLFEDRTQLLVSGDGNTGELKVRNVRADWLNLPTDFHGFMAAHPKQTQAGFILEYLQHLDNIFDSGFFDSSWFSMYMPLLVVHNHLELCQWDVRGANSGSSNQPTSIFQAFNQPSWCNGRIAKGRTRVRPAEIRLSLGKTYMNEDLFQIIYYSTLVIPTGNKQRSKYTFDTVVGNNRHAAMGGGVNFQITLNRDISQMGWCFFMDLEALYLFHNEQHRTYDLKGKPWSRYLQYNYQDGPPNQNIPGVNIMTFRTLVRPFGWFDFCMGWRFKTEWIEGEFGYSVWGHSGERLKLLKHQFRCPFGIAGVGPVDPLHPTCASSASNSTIKTLAANDETFIPVKKSDINLFSAAARSALNHQVHAGIGMTHNGECYDGLFGGGFFFDIPQKNGDLQRWGLWAKFGSTF